MGRRDDTEDDARSSARPTDDRYRIAVETGAHAGAEITLPAGAWVVGDSVSADLFLVDLPGEAREIRLEAGHAFFPGDDERPEPLPRRVTLGPARLAISGPPPGARPLTDAERAAAAAEAKAQAERAARMRAEADAKAAARTSEDAGAKAAAAAPSDHAPQDDRRARHAMVVALGAAVGGILALGALLIGVIAPGADRDARLEAQSALATASPETADAKMRRETLNAWLAGAAPGLTAARVVGARVWVEGATSDAALAALTEQAAAAFPEVAMDLSNVVTPQSLTAALAARLADSDAGRALTVTPAMGPDGRPAVAVVGALTADRFRFWTDVQTWFSERYGDRATLLSEVAEIAETADGPPRIALEAVWLGRDPYIVTADGRRTRAGELLPNGWRVASVDAEAVRFIRGEREEIVTLPAPRPLDAAKESSE